MGFSETLKQLEMKVKNQYIVKHHCSTDRNNRAILFQMDNGLFYCQYINEDGKMVLEIQCPHLAKDLIDAEGEIEFNLEDLEE